MEEWKDCEELKPKPKEKWSFVNKRNAGNEASNRVAPGSEQVSMHEARKKRQIDEDVRQM